MREVEEKDESWRDWAHRARLVLGLLGRYKPQCLPGEPDQCGEGYAGHFAAYAAEIRALLIHHASHVGMPQEIEQAIFKSVTDECDANCKYT